MANQGHCGARTRLATTVGVVCPPRTRGPRTFGGLVQEHSQTVMVVDAQTRSPHALRNRQIDGALCRGRAGEIAILGEEGLQELARDGRSRLRTLTAMLDH